DVACIKIGQCDTRDDFPWFAVWQANEALHQHLHVDQLEQHLRNLDVWVSQVGVAHVLPLNARTVAEHDVCDGAGGWGGVDRPGVPGAYQAGESADVVVMCVRDDDGVQRARVERELPVWAARINPFGVKQPTVEQDPPGAKLQQMSAPGYLPGRAMKRDS